MKILLSTWAVIAAFSTAVTGTAPPLTSYEYVLTRFVDAGGLVDYAGLKASRAQLDAACAEIARVDHATYESWNEDFRIAYWLNAYNAFTLKLIVDHYPIQPSAGKSQYPANSIRQVPGAWEEKKFRALGREVTLDEIEHKILRVEFKDPRIHMALVCAAMSCPNLRVEPYSGGNLDRQLDDQSRKFLSDPRQLRIDREAGEVWASPIFDWFADDFLPGATSTYPRHVAQQKALAAFASRYLSPEDARYLENGNYVVKYFEYDWTLNEQSK